jgi:hypothetical protein
MCLLRCQTILSKEVNLQEDFEVHEFLIFRIYKILALNQTEVKYLSLITFVSEEGGHVSTDLFDLHVIRQPHVLDIYVVRFDQSLNFILLLSQQVGRHHSLLYQPFHIQLIYALLLLGKRVKIRLLIIVQAMEILPDNRLELSEALISSIPHALMYVIHRLKIAQWRCTLSSRLLQHFERFILFYHIGRIFFHILSALFGLSSFGAKETLLSIPFSGKDGRALSYGWNIGNCYG